MPVLSLLSLISRNSPKRLGRVSPELDKSGPGLRLSGLAGIDKPEAPAKAFSKSWNDLRLRFRLVIDKLNGSIAVGRTGLCRGPARRSERAGTRERCGWRVHRILSYPVGSGQPP